MRGCGGAGVRGVRGRGACSVPAQENTERAPQRFQGDLGRPGHSVLQSLETHDFLACKQIYTGTPSRCNWCMDSRPGLSSSLRATKVQEEIQVLEPDMLRAIMENAIERARACKAENKVIFVASFFIKVQKMGHPVEKT